MTHEYIYALALILCFIIGALTGGIFVLWSIAKDSDYTRIEKDDVIVKKEDLEKLKKKLNNVSDDD